MNDQGFEAGDANLAEDYSSQRQAAMKRAATIVEVLRIVAFTIGVSVVAAAGKGEDTKPGELVRQAVARELKAADTPGHYMYQLRKDTPERSETQAMIETRDWLIGRLTRINGKPLTSQERKREGDRIARLLDGTNALRKEEASRRKDERRVKEMVSALPEAFVYEYDRSETNSDGDRLERLTFAPKVGFYPSTGELAVFSGMKGTMLVNTTAMRIERIEATLFRSVSFGWGIVARLDPGGTFVFEQVRIGDGRWAIKKLAVHFSGKVLLVKSLHIDSTLTTSGFRRMPDDLTLRQGLELLKEQVEMKRE